MLIGALLLTLAAPAAVQEPTEEPTVGQLMAALRKRDVEWYERDRLVDQLLDRGVPGAKALAKHASSELRELDADWQKDSERYLGDFADAAGDLVQDQQPRGADQEIEALRKEALAVSRGEGLTKERIRAEVDPRLALLRELLRVAPRSVRASDEKLDDKREALEDLADLLDIWAAVWRDASELLAADEAGADVLRRIKEPPTVSGRMDALDAEELWLTILATPMRDRDRRVFEENRVLSAQLDGDEGAGILHHNRIRVELGLHAQAIDLKLCEAGRGHSKDMHDLGFFAHESPVEGKKTPSDRAQLAGTSGGAENIARGQRTGVAAVDAWWYSPGHHRNMLGGGTRIGLGRFETFWTEMFG